MRELVLIVPDDVENLQISGCLVGRVTDTPCPGGNVMVKTARGEICVGCHPDFPRSSSNRQLLLIGKRDTPNMDEFIMGWAQILPLEVIITKPNQAPPRAEDAGLQISESNDGGSVVRFLSDDPDADAANAQFRQVVLGE